MQPILFTNGRVIPMEREDLSYPACAVRDSRICGVGSREFLKEMLGGACEEIDMQGGALLPGFVDCHFHLVLACYFKMNLDLMGLGVQSIEELLTLLADHAASGPPGKWILGLRFNEMQLREKRFPSLSELDTATPDHPLLIMRYDAHSGIANSRALELAGIRRDTANPVGGVIERSDGELTGILKEKAMVTVFDVIPVPEVDELLAGRDRVRESLLSQGITGYHNIMLTNEDGPSGKLGPFEIPLFKMFEDGLPFRHYPLVAAASVSETVATLQKAFTVTQTDGCWQKGAMKLFADGTFGSRTALLHNDYTDAAGVRGMTVCDMNRLRETIFEAHREGLRVAVHTIGDSAVDQVAGFFLDASQQFGFKPLRHRIEHCSMIRPQTLAVLKNAGVLCSMQPSFIVSEGSWIRDRVGDRVSTVYPLKSLVRQGIPACAGSDAPVELAEPLAGIGATITREGFTSDEALTAFEALSLYTSRAAYASFDENERGTVTPGKAADLVLLDQNPLAVAPGDIKDIRTRLTMIDGVIHFQDL